MKHLITLRRYTGTEYTVVLPKTVVDQVDGLRAHVENTDIHVSTADRHIMLSTAKLDDTGKISAVNIKDKPDLRKAIEFTSREDRDAKVNTLPIGQLFITALDNGGWEMGIHTGEGKFTVFADTLSIDIDERPYGSIKEKPLSSVEAIDKMVEDSHLHANLAVLDKVTDKSFDAKRDLQRAITVRDGMIPPNTDGLGTGSLIFVLEDPKVNPELDRAANSLPSVLLKLNKGDHLESIATQPENRGDRVVQKFVSNIRMTNTSTNCGATVRVTMTRRDGEIVNTDYILDKQEVREIKIDVPELYVKYDFKIVDLDIQGEVDPSKYGAEVDIYCDEIEKVVQVELQPAQ